MNHRNIPRKVVANSVLRDIIEKPSCRENILTDTRITTLWSANEYVSFISDNSHVPQGKASCTPRRTERDCKNTCKVLVVHLQSHQEILRTEQTDCGMIYCCAARVTRLYRHAAPTATQNTEHLACKNTGSVDSSVPISSFPNKHPISQPASQPARPASAPKSI